VPCNWGVIGAGFIANRALIPAIQAARDARVLAVASLDEQRAQATASAFAIPRIYHDYTALLDDPDVQVVYIALPNHLHREWTIQAARRGKHVLCEKPLAINAAGCDEMIHACRQANVLLMEAVMYRFHPRMQALKSMLDAGEAGELRFLHSAFSFPFNAPGNYRAFPKYGGGALLDVGCYCINAVRWLSGSEPISAQAVISYSLNGIDTSASAILHFEHCTAHIQCSFEAAEYQVIEVVGSRAAITAPLAFTAWRDDAVSLYIQYGGNFKKIDFAPCDPYRLMVEHFTDCVLDRAALLYPPEDGRATMRALEMVRQSVDVL
jgi:xylose dehydrogenase (NAD/NADP)